MASVRSATGIQPFISGSIEPLTVHQGEGEIARIDLKMDTIYGIFFIRLTERELEYALEALHANAD